nr:hypothetical protein [Candidatus Sigynarchaeota archaeon]
MEVQANQQKETSESGRRSEFQPADLEINLECVDADDNPAREPERDALCGYQPIHPIASDDACHVHLYTDRGNNVLCLVIDVNLHEKPAFLQGTKLHALLHVRTEDGISLPAMPGASSTASGQFPSRVPRAHRFSRGWRKYLAGAPAGVPIRDLEHVVECNDEEASIPPGLGLPGSMRDLQVVDHHVYRAILHEDDRGRFVSFVLDVELQGVKPWHPLGLVPGRVLHVLLRLNAKAFEVYPCAACGSKNPGLFWVPDRTWSLVAGHRYWRKKLCFACFRNLARAKKGKIPVYEAFFPGGFSTNLLAIPPGTELHTIVQVANE